MSFWYFGLRRACGGLRLRWHIWQHQYALQVESAGFLTSVEGASPICWKFSIPSDKCWNILILWSTSDLATASFWSEVVSQHSSRIEALRIADSFRARILDSSLNSFVFEVTGATDKVSAFVDLMESLGKVEVARTGICGITRGNKIDLAD